MRVLCLAVLTSLLAQPVAASTQNVIFNGTVAPTCTLTVNSNGTMTVSTSLQSLSSQNVGGSPGTVSLSTTGGVDLSVDAVTGVTRPNEDTTPTTWTPSFSASGSHSIALTTASTELVAPGNSTVTVHLAGVKGGTDRFAAGDYEATVTVRCE